MIKYWWLHIIKSCCWDPVLVEGLSIVEFTILASRVIAAELILSVSLLLFIYGFLCLLAHALCNC